MVVEVDVPSNHLVGFREGGWFVPVNALCFEDREEISAGVVYFPISEGTLCLSVFTGPVHFKRI